MNKLLESAGEKALYLARKKGAEAEVYLLRDRELNIEVAGGTVETVKEAEELGLGLRILHNRRPGFAYTSDLSEQAIYAVVDDAVNISRYTAEDQYNSFPCGGMSYPEVETYAHGIAVMNPEDKIQIACDIENAARQTDPRITIVEKAGYEEREFEICIMNTTGLHSNACGNYCGIYVIVVAEMSGEAQSGFSMSMSRDIEGLKSAFVGREAAQRALRSLNARTIQSAVMPCIMEPYVVTRFMGILSRMVDAEAVQKGKSLFAGKIGENVASKVVSLKDDATFKHGIASFPFDGEGVPSRENIIINNGILKNFLYDTYAANKAGLKSSGNAQRASYRSLPSVGTTNFILNPGVSSPEKLVREVDRGVYITDVMGMHTANPISGDFSVGAAGLLIENGKITHPVRGITIAGNLIDCLQDIDAVGNDLRFYGAKGAPTIRLQKISVGGN